MLVLGLGFEPGSGGPATLPAFESPAHTDFVSRGYYLSLGHAGTVALLTGTAGRRRRCI